MNPTSTPSFSHPPRFASLTVLLSSLTFCLGMLFLAAGCTEDPPFTPIATVDPLDGERINNFYTNEEIRYFLDVALGDPEDNSEGAGYIEKWVNDIRISLEGNPTSDDSIMVRKVIAQLKRLVGTIDIILTDVAPNTFIHFLPPDEFHLVEPRASGDGDFQAWLYFNSGAVVQAELFVTSKAKTHYERDPMILETMATMLGIRHRSGEYPESVFYYFWDWPTELAPIDRTVIELLYSPEIYPGMTRGGVIAALTNR